MGSQEIIANELLAFLQYALAAGVMDEVSIKQICKSSFSEDEICSSKALLFEKAGKADQMPSRRRDGGVKSLQDIINLLRGTDSDDVPAFVAKRLDKLPPVTFDHVDVTRLLKDVTFLKASLEEMQTKLEASNNTVSELRAEIVSLRDAVSVSRSHVASNVAPNRERDARGASVCSFESANQDASPNADAAPAASQQAPTPRLAGPAPALVGVTSRAKASTPRRAYADAAAARTPAAPRPPQQLPKPKSCDSDGFTLVERKKKPARRNQCGTAVTGTQHLLQPAVPTTLLYVSRLHYTTKAENIVEYVKVKTNFMLRVERLESRHNVNFVSFVVRVPTAKLSTFMQEEFWPKGVVFRRFRGRLPDTLKLRHTSPI